MKKIFSLICMATLALSFVACSDDDEVGAEYNRASTISVVKSDVLFSASAGTGTVVVKSQGPITFSSASDWCKATALNDSTVQVSVDNNETNSGRSSLLTIKSGVDSVNVTVQQQGFYFQSDMGTAVSLANGASREAFALNTNGKTVVSTTADWLTASVENDSVVVSSAVNETGHMRQAYVKYSFGEFKDSVLVSQYDFAEDIAGTYYLAFTNASTGKTSAFQANLVADEAGKLSLILPDLGFTIPVNFDAASCKLSIAAGSYIGDYQVDENTIYNMGIVLGDSEAGYITWSPSVTYSAAFHNDEDGTYAEFENDGSWTYNVNYLSLYAFSSKEFTGDTRIGGLMNMIAPYLLKIDASGARKKMNVATPKLSIMK